MPSDQSPQRDARATNAAIVSFLQYYIDPRHPLDYAVLISGPWGAGKTHLIRHFLETSDANPLYVSLYGMTTTSQIEDEFYRLLHPILSSKGMKVAGAVMKAIAKGALKIDFDNDGKDEGSLNVGLPDIDLKADLADPRNRLLIFDDLERCKMSAGEVLGFINGYVEHDGLKSIIIANETKLISDDPSYLEIKEKLIGQTLVVAAAAEEALDEFLKLVSDDRTREFLTLQRSTVLALHAQGGRGNLRSLKHAIWDFEKIARHLEERHWANEQATVKLLKGVFAITMEHRAGELDESVLNRLLESWLGRALRKQREQPKDAADLIDERYPQVDFDDVCLSADILAAVVLRGEVDPVGIRQAIDASCNFAPVEEQPLWLRAWQILRKDDATAEAIVKEVEDAFSSHSVHAEGELMHLLGLRLWFATIGLGSYTRDQVLAEGLRYIQHLEGSGFISVQFDMERTFDRFGSFNSHRVFDAETSEYRQLANAYRDARLRQEQSKYLNVALSLLERLPDNPDEVLLDTVPNNVRSAPFYDRPVFAAIPPRHFVSCLLDWDPQVQSSTIELLHGRHELKRGPEIEIERQWLHEVDRLLTEAVPDLQPLSRYRLQSLIDEKLAPLRPEPAPTLPSPAPNLDVGVTDSIQVSKQKNRKPKKRD